jgi:pilus assembly protein CpaC
MLKGRCVKHSFPILISTLALVAFSNSYAAGEKTNVAAVLPATPQPSTIAPLKPCTSVTVDSPTNVLLGKSTVVKLGMPAVRMIVGGVSSSRAGKPIEKVDDKTPAAPQLQQPSNSADGVADIDVMLLSPTELFFLGKRAGSMNVILQSADGRCVIKDLIVTIDPNSLQLKLKELMPEETAIRVSGAENALVLSGTISDAVKLDLVLNLAVSYGDGKKVVNMLSIAQPQQVMLEVKIAEVSKNMLDKLGSSISVNRFTNSGNATYSVVNDLLTNAGGALGILSRTVGGIQIDGQKDDGLVRILAEPNIMAISGQPASFLSGGKIFIPVSSDDVGLGRFTVRLQEKEFGIGVKFTPTVLDGTRINLKVASEVSELQQTGNPFATVNGVVQVIPTFTVRKADTTVQLNDGQSFMIAGLIKNNVTETIKRFPGLGEIPILGALFRSTEFKRDQTELIFVITPRLVKPLAEAPRLPTDNHVVPSRAEVYYNGAIEGRAPTTPARREGFAPPPTVPASNAK